MNVSAFRAVIFLAACALFTSLPPAYADGPSNFYKGKMVTLYVGFGAGGSTDLYGRVTAHHMQEHMPGKPNIIVRNRPGAGSLILANELFNVLPKDGSVIGTIDRNAALEAIWENPQAKFVPVEFNWLGSANSDVSTCAMWHASGVRTLKEFMTKEHALGAVVYYHANVLNNLFGAKLKQTAYQSGKQISLAMERGEVEGRCNWSWSSVKSSNLTWFKEGKINIIVQFAYEKHPDLPNVPLVLDLISNDKDRQIVDLMLSTQVSARPFVAPPEVPEARVRALRSAFEATYKDQAFADSAAKRKLEVNLVSGEKVQAIVARISSTPKEIVRTYREAATKSDR